MRHVSPPSRFPVVIGFSLLCVAASACNDPTQIRLHLKTDIPYEQEEDRLVAITATSDTSYENAEPSVLTAPAWDNSGDMGTLVLVPDENRNSTVNVRVVLGIARDPSECTAGDPDGCIIARRKLNFVEHKTIELPVGLHAVCEGVACDESSTCNALGECVPADIDPGKCSSPDDPDCLPVDDGLPEQVIDAGAPDAAPDAIDGGNDAETSCDPASITVLGEAVSPAGNNSQAVDVEGNYAFIGHADGTDGLQVFDVTDPAAIVPLGFFTTATGPGALNPTSNDVLSVRVVGSQAFLTTYRGGLVIVDVSDPSNPSFLGGLPLSGENWSVWPSPSLDYALVGNYSSGLVLVDVSDPSAPVHVGSTPLPNQAHRFVVDPARELVFAIRNAHLTALAWNPSSGSLPTIIDDLDGFAFAYDVWSDGGDYVYVVDHEPNELVTVSFVNDTLERVNTQILPSGEGHAVDGVGGYLYVGTGVSQIGNLEAFSLADPALPSHIRSLPADNRVFDVAADDDGLVYLASGWGRKLQIVRGCGATP